MNNDPANLFVFSNKSIHTAYHYYIKRNYITPEEYLPIYNYTMINKLENYDWLYNKYINENMTIAQIAELLQFNYKTVSKYINLYNLK